MRKRRKATIATLATLASVMVVTVASAGVSQNRFDPSFGGFSGLKGGGLTAGSQILYDNPVGTAGHWDWTNPAYAMADDVHFKDNDTAGFIITALAYGYWNLNFPTVSHTIVVYDMVPPSGTHGFSSITGFAPALDVGAALGTIAIPGLVGTGPFTVTITGLSIQVGHAAWISFDESVHFGGQTFWLSGGVPVIGASHDVLGAFDPTVGLYLQYPHPLAFVPATGNIAMTITGHKIPGPSVIALLGLSGLATLSRRRLR